MIGRIRASLSAGRTPSSHITGDPSLVEWTFWDVRLVNALQQYDDMLVGSIPVYWDQNEEVAFDVKTIRSRSEAAIEQRRNRDSKKKGLEGVRYYATPRKIGGGPLPSLEDWIKQQDAKRPLNGRE